MRNLVFKASNWILVGNLTQEGLTGSLIRETNLEKQVSEKIFKELRIKKPYRKPTQVDKRKYAKVNGWDLVKELGKQVAVSSQYGLPPSQDERLQHTYSKRLFIKNTTLC